MKALIENVKAYIVHALGENPALEKLSANFSSHLPFYLSKGYTFYKGSIQHTQIIFAIPQSQTNYTPQKLKKEAEALSDAFQLPIVFIFQTIEGYNRLRFVEKKVPFIVPQKYLYIPFLATSFTEVKEKKYKARDKLRPISQCLLLYHLEIENLDNINFNTIGRRIGYSSMSITRAAEELEAFELVTIDKRNKERFLIFEESKLKLWNAALQFLTSPVKNKIYVRQLPEKTELLRTSDNALAFYSNLSPGNKPAYAIGIKDFRVLQKKIATSDIDYSDGEIHIEVWNYSPEILTKTDFVDPLSLYLSLRDVEDDRVKISLNQLIKNIW